MVLQFFCPICKEEFTAADEVFSTCCGHIFHNNCIRDWLNRSTSCPCCNGQTSMNNTFRVYITSRPHESEEQRVEILKLESELEQSIKNTSEVQEKLDESEKNFMELHHQLDAITNERVNMLHEKQCLEVVVESLQQELDKKHQEIEFFKENIDVANTEVAALRSLSNNNKMPLNESMANLNINKELAAKDCVIDDLRKQLQDKSLELEKEIRNSTMLIVEKMRLQSQINDRRIPPPVSLMNITTNPEFYNALRPKINNSTAQSTPGQSVPTNIPPQKCAQSDPCFSGDVAGFNGGHRFRPRVNRAQPNSRIDNAKFSVFQYAKKLQKFGFKTVYYERSEIYAKPYDGPPIIINSNQQVDDIIQKYLAFTKDVTAQPQDKGKKP